jgi:hypothetical protein
MLKDGEPLFRGLANDFEENRKAAHFSAACLPA